MMNVKPEDLEAVKQGLSVEDAKTLMAVAEDLHARMLDDFDMGDWDCCACGQAARRNGRFHEYRTRSGRLDQPAGLSQLFSHFGGRRRDDQVAHAERIERFLTTGCPDRYQHKSSTYHDLLDLVLEQAD